MTRAGRYAACGEARIFVDVERYSSLLIYLLENGEYEARERRAAIETLRPDDRVIEAGTAVGAVAITAAFIVGAESVLTFDANPHILADARRNFSHNGVPGINSRFGALAPRAIWRGPQQRMEFFVSSDFWASRSERSSDSVERVEAPVFCLEDEIAAHRATVLICDVEGAEVDLLTGADLSGLRAIILETHDRIAGPGRTGEMIRKLVNDGFDLDMERIGRQLLVMRRA